jgi:hypothetical protein
VRITEELAVVGVNFTKQAPSESLHLRLENLPARSLDQATMPVGSGESGTVASQVVAEPTATVAGSHDMVRWPDPFLATEKLVPSGESPEGCAKVDPSDATIATSTPAAPNEPIGPDVPLMVAESDGETVVQSWPE